MELEIESSERGSGWLKDERKEEVRLYGERSIRESLELELVGVESLCLFSFSFGFSNFSNFFKKISPLYFHFGLSTSLAGRVEKATSSLINTIPF